MDDKRDIVYCFGGDISFVNNGPPPPESIWNFTPNGKGGGNWTEAIGIDGAKSFPPGIIRPSAGAASSDDDDAYYLGGFISERTSTTVSSISDNTGLLRFGFENQTLMNSSELGLPFTPGALLNIPIYGSNGVLVALGGGDESHYVSFNNITVYDKKEQKWYSQIAEGEIPQPRSYFCAVGVQGKGRTSFEM